MNVEKLKKKIAQWKKAKTEFRQGFKKGGGEKSSITSCFIFMCMLVYNVKNKFSFTLNRSPFLEKKTQPRSARHEGISLFKCVVMLLSEVLQIFLTSKHSDLLALFRRTLGLVDRHGSIDQTRRSASRWSGDPCLSTNKRATEEGEVQVATSNNIEYSRTTSHSAILVEFRNLAMAHCLIGCV